MSIYGIEFTSADGKVVQTTIWIGPTEDEVTLIKDVCGMYPSGWDGMTCDRLAEILENGIGLLKERSGDLTRTTITILTSVLENCRECPDTYVVMTLG